MDYRDTPDEAAFRHQLRGWLAETKVPNWKDADSISEAQRRMRIWNKALHDAGYLAIGWPTEEGGQGLSPIFNLILNDEIGKADCPPYPGWINIFPRAISIHGTDAQRERFVPATLDGEIIWCQGFSEPGAGSDIASMSTRAVRSEGGWIISGQKLWTTSVIYADWCFLLARTDDSVSKHRGISAFLVSLDSPGITAGAVELANGNPETGQLFLDDVFVPDDQMLGGEGDGWRIALSTFSYERNPVETEYISELRQWMRSAEQLASDLGKLDDIHVRRRLADIRTRIDGLVYVGLEQLSARVAEGRVYPGEESSVGKLLWTYAGQEMQHFVLDLLGSRPLADPQYNPMGDYIWSRVLSVFGGTEQIQKNVLAWRVLGLPRV
ncbi:acyl-CoA dehydrogenase family protein [Microbacterium soli]|uniref:Acyl-CoA dehydrogenase family protein n=1 Tax=Microbacterium soli TaxID=446075 RepID=A0ABP7MXD5_9MICO